MSTATDTSPKNIIISPEVLKRMRDYLDDQIATSKLMQGEIDLLTGNYQSYHPSEFLNDLKSNRDIPV